MANSVMDQTQGALPRRDYRTWLAGLVLFGSLMLGLGLWLAGLAGGVALPWAGVGLGVAMALAMIVGVSKTSSA